MSTETTLLVRLKDAFREGWRQLAKDEFGRDGKSTISERVEKRGSSMVIDELTLSGLNATRWDIFTSQLSTEYVARCLLLAESGNLIAANALYEQMEERDPSLHSAMMTRRAGPMACERIMLPARPPKGKKKGDNIQFDPDLARQVADDTMWVVENINDFDGTLIDALDAVGKSIAVLEVDWNAAKDGTIDSIRHVNPRLYNFDFETGDLYVTNTDNSLELKRIFIKDYDYKFIVHRSKMRAGHACRGGVMRTITWTYVFRNYAWRDQSVYTEIFGMPMRIGKYKPNATPQDKTQLATMLKQMASNAWALISETTEIEFEEAVNRGVEPYTAFLNALRSEYFLAILGQEGTNVTNKYGSKGDTQIKQLVRQDILEADCKQLENTLRWQLLYPIVFYRWGKKIADAYCPLLHFKYEPAMALAQQAEIDKKVLIDMGVGSIVSRKEIAKRYNFETIEDSASDEDRILPKDFVPGVTTQTEADQETGSQPTTKSGQPSKAKKKSGKPDSAKKAGDNAKRNQKLRGTMAIMLAKKFDNTEEQNQEAVNQFIELVTEKADETMAPIVAPLISLVSECTSFEELRDKLEEVYGDLDSDKLQIALGWSMMASRLFGRKAIVERVQ